MNREQQFVKELKNQIFYELDYWDPKHFPWDYQHILLTQFTEYVDIWWDPRYFDWKNKSKFLLDYLIHEFDLWWTPELFNWEKHSFHLTIQANKYFKKWWDVYRFNLEQGLYGLFVFCGKYFSTWFPDIIRVHPNFRETFKKYMTPEFIKKLHVELLLDGQN